jgi:hypothetical protein
MYRYLTNLIEQVKTQIEYCEVERGDATLRSFSAAVSGYDRRISDLKKLQKYLDRMRFHYDKNGY